jgi:hypothetical protein
MIKAEKDILIHKKSEQISKKIIKKLWDNRQEFSPMLEQIILETLKDSLEIISVSHTEKAEDIFGDSSILSDYQSYQIGLKFGEIVGRSKTEAVNILMESNEQERIIKQTRFLFVVK